MIKGHVAYDLPLSPDHLPMHGKLSDKMLKGEEVKVICETHSITRKEVFQMRSLFLSMCLMSE